MTKATLFQSLRLLAVLAILLLIAMTAVAFPTEAHRDHDRAVAPQSETQNHQEGVEINDEVSPENQADSSVPETNHEVAEDASFGMRSLDWLGRTHPIVVHFPIALFPVGLIAVLIARRRPDWMTTARYVVGVAGFAALPATFLGWLAGGWAFAGDDALTTVHRWLGTAIALMAAALLTIAWRRMELLTGKAGIAGLLLINVALIVQGWYGGALVHGADHLNF